MASSFSMELEHAIGYLSTQQPSLHVLASGRDVAYAQGSCVVLRSCDDPHQQAFLRGHAAELSCLALSRRGTFLASGDSGRNSDVVVWDVQTRAELWRLSEHDNGIRVLSFSPDERLLLVIGCDNRLNVMDVKTGMMVVTTELPKSLGTVSAACWSGFVKDLKRRDTPNYQFATAGEQVALWSLNPYTGAIALEPADSRRNVRQCTCVAFVHLPDAAGRDNCFDEFLIAGTQSGDFVSYLCKPNREAAGAPPTATFTGATRACSGGVVSLAPNRRDECVLMVGGGDGSLIMFQYREHDGTWIDMDGTTLRGAVTGLGMSPCGTFVAAGSAAGELVRGHLGSLSKGVALVASNPCGPVVGISFAPDSSEVFATASLDGFLRVWSMEDYRVTMQTTAAGAGHPTCLQFGIDAILSGWTDGCVRSHHAETGELLWQIKDAHSGGVSALRLSNNLRYVVTAGEEGEVRVWELRRRSLVSHLKEHSGRVNSIVIFDDDVHAISCSRDRSFLCWDLRRDKRISAHTQRMGGINCLALNHDQTLVISVGQERSISLWDLRDRYPIASVVDVRHGMHADEATSVAVSHAGSLFATGGADHLVKLWRLEGDRPVLVQDNVGHTAAVTAMAFTADDRQLVSVGAEGAIFVWNIFPEDVGGGESKGPASS